MTYCLDTNIISYLMKGNKSVLQKLDALAEDDNEAKAFGEEMKTMRFLSQTTRGILGR